MSRPDGATAAQVPPCGAFDACAVLASVAGASLGWAAETHEHPHGGPVMATPTDLLDPPAVMSYGGLVDASTAEGQTDDATDWGDALSQMLIVYEAAAVPAPSGGEPRPAHMADITRRRGTYSPAR
jgi:hypothetical protein